MTKNPEENWEGGGGSGGGGGEKGLRGKVILLNSLDKVLIRSHKMGMWLIWPFLEN